MHTNYICFTGIPKDPEGREREREVWSSSAKWYAEQEYKKSWQRETEQWTANGEAGDADRQKYGEMLDTTC